MKKNGFGVLIFSTLGIVPIVPIGVISFLRLYESPVKLSGPGNVFKRSCFDNCYIFLKIGLFIYSSFFMVIYSFYPGFSICFHGAKQSNLRILECPPFCHYFPTVIFQSIYLYFPCIFPSVDSFMYSVIFQKY